MFRASVTARRILGAAFSLTLLMGLTLQAPVPAAAQGSIGVTKVADESSVTAGDPIGFTITVTNNGDVIASGVTLTDELPTDSGTAWTIESDLDFADCAIATGTLTCGPDDIAAAETYTVHITSRTNATTSADSPVDNTALVDSTDAGSNEASDSIEVLPQLTVTKVADDASVTAGQDIGFTITVTNNGDVIASGVTLTDELPTDSGTAWTIESDLDFADCAIATGTLTCGPDDIAAAETYTVHITSRTNATTSATSPVDNTALVDSTDAGSNEASDSIEVLAAGGSISGTVEGVGGSALYDICVTVGTGHGPVATRTLADGTYSLVGLDPGHYFVLFTDCVKPHIFNSEWWNDSSRRSSANPVVVRTELDTGNINAVLEAHGSISGTVEGSGGSALEGICVNAYGVGLRRPAGGARTLADGTYSVGRLDPGTYQVFFSDCTKPRIFIPEWYDNHGGRRHAEILTLASGEHLSNINADLDTWGSISGTVEGDGGSSLEGICATAFDTFGRFGGAATTLADGTYIIRAMQPGDYQVYFDDCHPPRIFTPEWFDDALRQSRARLVHVVNGRTTPNINAVLAGNGSIAGTVEAAGGSAIAHICVNAYFADSGRWAAETQTLADGTYQLKALRAHDYKLLFYDCFRPFLFASEWYNDADGKPSATPVAVSSGDHVGNINAVLSLKGDTRPPDTTITSGPTGTTNDPTPTFTFTSSELNSTFECRVDANPFGPCASPFTTGALTDGPHTFDVRATDAAGNVDPTPASRTWTIDTTPPNTLIDSGPRGTVKSTSATFTFHSTEAGSSFECQLDAGDWTSCTNPKTYTGLAEGRHTFRVRATDPVGNIDPSPAFRTWTIDTTPPDTLIDSGPSGTVKSTSATFKFHSTEAGSRFECQLDAGGWTSCTSPKTYKRLAGGSHTFYVRATDAVGNTDPTPASRTWTIKLS